jgi:Ser/Thr protein kinase RdoA (MazF antagonist)
MSFRPTYTIRDLEPPRIERALPCGRRGAITAADAELLPAQGLAGAIYRVRLSHGPGGGCLPATLIAKFHSADDRARTIQRSIGMYRTEAGFYRDLACSAGVPVPRCYHASCNRHGDRALFLLQDVPGETVDDQCGLSEAQAEAAIDLAATLHATFWGDRRLERLRWLRTWTRHPHVTANPVRPPIEVGPEVTSLQRQLVPGILRDVASMRRRLREVPQTLIHGDFSGKNLVFDRVVRHRPRALIDWQLTRRGPAMIDIANLLAYGLNSPTRVRIERDLLLRYQDRLSGKLGYRVPLAVLLSQYEAAVALRCLRPLALTLYLPFEEGGEHAAAEFERVADAWRSASEMCAAGKL